MNRLLWIGVSQQDAATCQALFADGQQWDCHFADNIKKAFDELSHASFDIVIADAKMPVFNGVPLMETISQMYPNIIRVVLVRSLGDDYPKRLVKFVHRILVRPDSTEKLEMLISRIYRLYKTVMHPEVIRFVDGLEKIPSLPKVYGDLVAELESPNPSVKKAGILIARDIGMSASILKMVNSAYFGIAKPITSPELAVSLLGLDIVRGLALTSHLFSAFSNAETRLLNLETVVDHCLIVGFLAKEILKHENMHNAAVDSIYIAGILHDIGRLIFASHSPKIYRQVIDIAEKENRLLYEIEKELFGAMHAEIGAYLLGQWGLSESVIELIAYHHCEDVPEYITLELSALKAADAFSREVLPMSENDILDKIFSDSPLLSDKKDEWHNVCIEAIKKSTMKF